MTTRGEKQLSPQARLLRKTVLGKLAKQLLVCLAVFLLVAFLLERLASGPVATYLADAAETRSYPITSTEDEKEAQASLQAYLDTRPNAVWDIQTNPVDHSIWVRDLTLYHLVKVAWLPALACIALSVVVALILSAFRRMYGLVDDLADGVASLLHTKGEPIRLPAELAVTERELEGLRQESLEREDKAQRDRARAQELMAYLAHDVRTPLTAIIGNLTLLEESPELSAEERHRASRALGRATEIEELTGDLFDVTRISLDPKSVSLEPVDLRLLALQVADELIAADKPVVVEDQQDTLKGSGPELIIRADPKLLAKALRHLVQTALALSDPDIPVSLNETGANGTASLLVCATTAPMDQAEALALKAHAFEPYYLKGSARGVSLEFAREIARAHGGDVTLSIGPRTATLALTLPLEQG